MKRVSVAGSTGSIGTQTLEVIRAAAGDFEVVSLGASSSLDLLGDQANEFRPKTVAISDESLEADLRERVPAGTEVRAGPGALSSICRDADVVVNGVVGFAGLAVTLSTLEAGKRLALANKESLIAAGPVVRRARATPGAEIIPVDSEHSALHQCLSGSPRERVRRLVLTASGGPFRGCAPEELDRITVDDALRHPTWSMGPKITIDSSTLMNKGLEVIEADELFGVGYDRIEVVVHPQSIVHSMVEFSDGATIAQLSQPDMRLPIGYALAWPDRLDASFGAIDWALIGQLSFEAPDAVAFPCLGLAYEAGREGGTAPAVLNAANEVAVAAFLEGKIRWRTIADVIKESLDSHNGREPGSVDDVVDADGWARTRAHRAVERRNAAA